uniref:Uncharacterized protein n=1 Tax=Arundo donax TaxID=35708 RepID=A0A0A9DB38_ARUDO
MGLLLPPQSAAERISTGGSASVPGANGQLKFETLARVSVFGLEHTSLLRRQLGHMMLKPARSVARKRRSIFLMKHQMFRSPC